jgi:hypothetical protein
MMKLKINNTFTKGPRPIIVFKKRTKVEIPIGSSYNF